jgi:uncharacterized protein (TIGR03067 family)
MKTLLAVLAVGLLLGAEAKDGKDQLDGTWIVVSMERDGKDRPDQKGGQLVFAGKNLTMKRPGDDQERKATFTTDPAEKPKTIDITPAEGAEAGKAAPGIYTLEKDELKICIARPGGDRPTDFKGTGSTDVVLIVLKREKK